MISDYEKHTEEKRKELAEKIIFLKGGNEKE